MYSIEYDGTYEEEQRIIAQEKEKGNRLIEVRNVTEGNFLIFDIDSLQLHNEITEIKRQQALIQQALDDIILNGGVI